MKTYKLIVDKLIIYDYPLPRPVYYYEGKYDNDAKSTGAGWCGISEETAAATPIKERYEGAAAIRKLWELHFDELDEIEKKLIRAVFPNVDKKDETTLKHSPDEILRSATIKARKAFGAPCTRCGASGNYSLSVSYTKVDNGVCHKCGGRGVSMPRLTEKKLAEIAKHFSGVAEC